MTQSIVRQSDLVLSVVGGARHGKTLSISTAKCVLAFDNDSFGESRPARCAILRGKAGVTIRNLDKQVSFNGHFSPTHWLKEGDLIQFPNSVALRVTRLGVFDEDAELISGPVGFSGNSLDQIESQSNGHLHNSSETVGFEAPSENEVEPQSSGNHWVNHEDHGFQSHGQPDSSHDLTCEPIEVKRITEMVDNRFEEIEKRINQLTEQISSLVTLATTGQFSSTRLNEAEWKSHLNSAPEIQDLQEPLSDRSNEPQPQESSAISIESDSWQGGFRGTQSFHDNRVEESDLGTATIWNATRLPIENEPALPRGFAELSERSVQSSAVERSDIPLLTPVRRDETLNQDSAGRDETESAVSKSFDPQSLVNSAPFPQAESGQTGSFRAATNALNQFQSRDSKGQSDELDSSSNSHSTFQNRVHPESEASNFTPATPSTDEALDALLKRLYQNQNSNEPFGKQPGFQPVSPERSSEPDTFEKEQAIGSELPDAEIKHESVATNGHDGNRQFSHDQSSNAIKDPAESIFFHGQETGFDTRNGSGFGEMAMAPSNLLEGGSRVAFESALEPELAKPESDTPGQNTAESSSGNSAIMDLLAKLKAEGAWDDGETQAVDDLPETSESNQVISYSSEEFESEAESESDLADANLADAIAATETETVAEVEEEAPVAADSVEDYMSQLLARMQKKRGDSEPTVKKSLEKAAKEVEAKSAADAKMADQELMTAEEYLPKQKAQKIHSFDTMREIANTTARTAVAYSDLDRRRTKGYMQVIITIGALIMAAYYFLFLSKEQADTSFMIGCVCVAISLSAGYLAFRSLTGLKSLSKKPKDA